MSTQTDTPIQQTAGQSRPRSRRWILVVCAAAAVIAAALVVATTVNLTQTIPIGAPRSLNVWLCVACLVAGLVVAGWRRAHRPRRVCGVTAADPRR